MEAMDLIIHRFFLCSFLWNQVTTLNFYKILTNQKL